MLLGNPIFWSTFLPLLTICQWTTIRADKWHENVLPKRTTNFFIDNELVRRFQGKDEFFRILKVEGSTVKVGARNAVLNISLDTMEENMEQRIVWRPKPEDIELCLLKGKSEIDCQNYVRVYGTQYDSVKNQTSILICGTNAYNPKCRTYPDMETNLSKVEFTKEFPGKGFCPYNPQHNSTTIFANGELYSATVSDFSGSDALIIRNQLRTEQYDFKHLNEPDFVNALQDDKHVFFFFRESAVEYINCGKTVFSRVSRVCKNDGGLAQKSKNSWTTFLKARLNCSVPGPHPFYFNEIQSTSEIIGGEYVYAVFTTPDNSISGSAVCKFSIKDINNNFETSPFKEQQNLDSNWLPIPKSKTPNPRPGTCSKEGTTISEASLHFLRKHTLLDSAVTGVSNGPIFIKTSLQERLTTVTVEPSIDFGDMLYVGTTMGKVYKLVLLSDEEDPILVETMSIFSNETSVQNLIVVKNGVSEADNFLVVMSDHEIAAVPLARCDFGDSCTKCVAMQDPHCGWDLSARKCVPNNLRAIHLKLIQDVQHGSDANCPIITTTTTTTTSTTTTTTTTSTTTTTTFTTISTSDTSMLPLPSDKQSVDENVGMEDTTTDSPGCICQETSVGDRQDAAASGIENEQILQRALEDIPLFDISNSLTAQKRQEKELNFFDEVLESDESQNNTEQVSNNGVAKEEIHLGGVATFSEQVLAVSIAAATILSMFLGFVAGFLVSRRCSKTYPERTFFWEKPSRSCEKSQDVELSDQSKKPITVAPDDHKTSEDSAGVAIVDSQFQPTASQSSKSLVNSLKKRNRSIAFLSATNFTNPGPDQTNNQAQKVKKTYV